MVNFYSYKIPIRIPGKQFLLCSVLLLSVSLLRAQHTQKVNAQFANGNVIDAVEIIVLNHSTSKTVGQNDLKDF